MYVCVIVKICIVLHILNNWFMLWYVIIRKLIDLGE